MIFHRKRQHKQGPCTVNFPQHCTFVSGVSQTCDWDRFKLNLISFVQGNRSPEKSHMIWAGLSTNAAEWVLNVLICYHCYLNTKNGNAHWHKEILTFITCMTNSFCHKISLPRTFSIILPSCTRLFMNGSCTYVSNCTILETFVMLRPLNWDSRKLIQNNSLCKVCCCMSSVYSLLEQSGKCSLLHCNVSLFFVLISKCKVGRVKPSTNL